MSAPHAHGQPGRTLEALLRHGARLARGGSALIDAGGVRATHDDLRRMRDAGRARLREVGVGPADHVAVALPSDWRMAAHLLAGMSACAVAPLDPDLPDREMTDHLARIRPRAILTDALTAPRLRALAADGTPVLTWSVDELDGPPDGEMPEPGAPALLLFTSGTTAAPKVAVLTQENLALAGASIAGTLVLGPGDRALNPMTMHHGHGIFPGTLAPLVSGGATATAPLAGVDKLLALATAARPTWYSAAPVIHHTILTMARNRPDIVGALAPRVVRSASSGLSPELYAGLSETFGVPVVEAYALTEAPGQIASNPLDGPRKPGSVGLPVGVEIALLTPVGELADAPGAAGEVLARGAIIMPGYLGIPDDQQPFHEGWLRTGDHGTFDEDGYLTLGGRIAEFIDRGAELFSPTEIEVVLAGHPSVAEVVAFGRAHPTLGEEPAAAVVLRPGVPESAEELISYAAERLASHKVPVNVYFLYAIPRGRTGKIVRRRVREMTGRDPSGRARSIGLPR